MTTDKEIETPETEVTERVTRRQLTDEYKLRILEEAERCNSGELGALLRREGLYSSYLSTWRAQRREGALAALGRKRGPKPKRTAEAIENEKLRKDNERLRERLRKAEKIIEVQKKVAEQSIGRRNTPQARWTDRNGEEKDQAKLLGGGAGRPLAKMEKRRVAKRHRQSAATATRDHPYLPG